MIMLSESAAAWGTPRFGEVLKAELRQVDAERLPLQEGLSGATNVAPEDFDVIVLGADEQDGLIHARAIILYSGIVAGCACADDPTPESPLTQFCQVLLDIDRASGEAAVELLSEEEE